MFTITRRIWGWAIVGTVAMCASASIVEAAPHRGGPHASAAVVDRSAGALAQTVATQLPRAPHHRSLQSRANELARLGHRVHQAIDTGCVAEAPALVSAMERELHGFHRELQALGPHLPGPSRRDIQAHGARLADAVRDLELALRRPAPIVRPTPVVPVQPVVPVVTPKPAPRTVVGIRIGPAQLVVKK